MSYKEEKIAIVVIVLGDNHQSFFNLTKPFIDSYAKKVGAEVCIYSDQNLLPDSLVEASVTLSSAIRMPIPFILKCWAIGDALKKYHRVLLMDSTCLPRSDCPNIFLKVPKSSVGGYNEMEWKEIRSWKVDTKLALDMEGIKFEKYFNGGVLIVSREHILPFLEEQLIKNVHFFSTPYPVQLYLNVNFVKLGFKLFSLNKDLNYMPVFNYALDSNRNLKALSSDEMDEVMRHSFLIHVTGYYKNRLEILLQIIERLKAEP